MFRSAGHGFKLATHSAGEGVRAGFILTPEDMGVLMAFKASERKDDPSRRHGLHGPYEELVLGKTGRLPEDYYDDGHDEPWGLRIEESRSTILWQVTSGLMDFCPEFAGAYMALALDHGLGADDYAHELSGLHRDWRRYSEHAGLLRDHRHQSMGHIYRSVACPACSVLTAMASRDQGMVTLFKNMAGLPPQERRSFLKEQGLLPYLTMMVPGPEIQMP